MNTSTMQVLNAAVEKLMTQLITKQEELRRAEAKAKGWNPRTCIRLRKEIASLETRLARAERLQDAELAKPLFG